MDSAPPLVHISYSSYVSNFYISKLVFVVSGPDVADCESEDYRFKTIRKFFKDQDSEL